MNDEYIELQIVGLTRGVTLRNACILVLQAKGESNYLPVLISEEGHKRLARALNNGDYECSNMLLQLAEAMMIEADSVQILPPEDGEFMGLITMKQFGEMAFLSVPIDQAMVFALNSGCPIKMERHMFNSMNRVPNTEGAMSLPLNGMSNELLNEALQAAVDAENFELASVLRDELRKRNGEAEETGSAPPQS